MKRVINGTKIESSKNFESNILKLFPKDFDKDIYLSSFGMKRKSGYGSYEIFLDVSIGNNTIITLTEHTNSSPLWDWYTDVEVYQRAYQNWAKSTVLELIENNIEEILEEEYEDIY